MLKAFSPFFAGDYLVRHGTDGWRSLGGILLAFTGVEALFADLGAFSRRSVKADERLIFPLIDAIVRSKYRGYALHFPVFCWQ